MLLAQVRFLALIRGDKKVKIERIAHQRGYRAISGRIISPHNDKNRALYTNKKGYRGIRIGMGGKQYTLFVHRLVAFQKFGEAVFEKGIVVRHLDGNPQNNDPDNIDIGTRSENELDRPKKLRISKAIKAGRANSNLEDDDIRKIRSMFSDGAMLKQIMDKYGIAKSTASYIKNRVTYWYID